MTEHQAAAGSEITIGLVVNPFAGIGGSVGLKGSDGAKVRAEALARGAVPQAAARVRTALKVLAPLKNRLLVLAAPGDMGANEARVEGFSVREVGTTDGSQTEAADTERIAGEIAALHPGLLMFAGGDGTARNICAAVGSHVPVIGIPAGVKIHSAVYANDPGSAGRAALQFLQAAAPVFREAEVMDIDEALFRQNRVQARLYGYLRIPVLQKLMQNPKAAARQDENDIGGLIAEIESRIKDDVYYVFGTGSTTYRIMQALGCEGTLLGVDAVYNGKTVLRDADEASLWQLLHDKKNVVLIVSVIGGQGHIFGRGNQQLSPCIIRLIADKNLWIVAAPGKIYGLAEPVLHTDTGDAALDEALSGYRRVLVGKGESIVCKVGSS